MTTFVKRFVRCACSIALLTMIGCATREPSGMLTILDDDTDRTVPARVWLSDSAGNEHIPTDAQVVPIGEAQKWFVSDGTIDLAGLDGEYVLRIERGPEYEPVKTTIHITDGLTSSHTYQLRRWINMHQRGYVCGENHLHVPADELGPQLAAEALDFGTSLQWWNAKKYEVPAGEGFIRTLEHANVKVPSSIFDFEIEHAWGAVYVVGMPHALDAPNDSSISNLPIVAEAHKAGALVCYQGGWSREVLLDALLGYVDVVNVCNNNFHRHQFQPRRKYSNLLNVESLPSYPDTDAGMLQLNTDTYYRLLNCGLHLAAGAGSATGPKMSPVGYNRAYVRAGQSPDLPEFLNSWRNGRNFVTNGPMLFMTVENKHQPGDTIALTSPGQQLHIKIEAFSDQPLTSIEAVVNGRVVDGKVKIDDDHGVWEGTVTASRGMWLAARCQARDELLADHEYANHNYGSKKMPRLPSRLRFAHTSPVYVTVAGQGAQVAASIKEAHEMLDAFTEFARKQASETHRSVILEAIETARTNLPTTP